MEQDKIRARVTDPPPVREIGYSLTNGVVTAAVFSEKQYPGIWRDMLAALGRGAAKTKEGTADAFLFQAMVDCLLAEFHNGERRGG